MSAFQLSHSIDILSRTPGVYRHLLQDLHGSWITATEGPETWSAFDIVGHLIHGEKTDWIPRARIILGDANEEPFPPFDRFAQFEASKGKTMPELLDEFARLREENLQVLQDWNLGPAEFARTGIHPDLGPVTLHQLLSTWTVHDLGHIGQVSRVMAKVYTGEVGPWMAYLTVLK